MSRSRPSAAPPPDPVPGVESLPALGAKIRARRQARGLTLKALAERSDLSTRYLVLIEQGEANLTLGKLSRLSDALGVPVGWLVAAGTAPETFDAAAALEARLRGRTPAELAEVAAWLARRFPAESAARPFVALLGVRGAGKSSVGAALAARLARPFVELDARVEAAADLSLAEIFAVHGDEYYRRLEREALEALAAAGAPAVVATGGSIVTHPENYARLRGVSTTVWLKARAEDHWERVIRQGDRRPMRDHPHAMAELRALLAAREPLYRQADLTVDTSALAPPEVVEQIATSLEAPGGIR